MIKLRDYLQFKQKRMIAESKLDNIDSNMIYKILESPKTTKFRLKSYKNEEVTTYKQGNNLTFSYNVELYDFTDTLVDILDTLSLKFNSKEDSGKISIQIQI
jgi:hypothetical protein